MKVFLRTCLASAMLLGGLHSTQAQTISNLNLDTWATRNSVDAPTNWLTSDDDFAAYFGQPAGTFNFGTVPKTTDKHGGTYAALLTSTTYNYTGGSLVIPGELILGMKPTANSDVLGIAEGGVALAARPAQMQFYYKLTGSAAAADSAIAVVYATKTTNGTQNVIGFSGYYMSPAASYTQFTIPITYSTTDIPDSLHIVFSSGYASNITAGTALYVDDVTISGVNLATHIAADVQAQLTVSPNPSTGGRFTIHSPEQPDLAASPLLVLDRMGRTVARQGAQAQPTGERELDLSGLHAGIYLLRIDSKQGPIVRPLTVQ